MIFSIRDLAFEIGSLYLEGWLALAARCVCALLLFAAGALVSLLLRRKLFPILQAMYAWGSKLLEGEGICPECSMKPVEAEHCCCHDKNE